MSLLSSLDNTANPQLGAKSEVIVIDTSGRDTEKAQQSDGFSPVVEPRTPGFVNAAVAHPSATNNDTV
jgi:hypothetical protein